MASKSSVTSSNLTPSRVDFGYSFATPHRLTVGRPDHSDRTLLDLQSGSLRWTRPRGTARFEVAVE